ncbi:hypothetical protein NEMBOFW57_000782 [Staphylotrichum longicolle]|uniref:Zinc finger CHCC-type domain-containing protein n=1 Tax=Staphylotrichum longicolle TaxID=669026 RepID=A0AAD4HXD2_9PEZI|nr:hypothetical protein NEMBOFW57_000782 [Staphylotrichum longicolle]
MYASRLRVAAAARHLTKRTFSATPRQLEAGSSTTSTTSPSTTSAAPVPSGGPVPAAVAEQAPNRAEVWSRSQRPRAVAMTGPRFEQTDFELQPRPYAAIELIHQQPVQWTHDRIVACDGGGGPAGHPKVYINTDKPEIATCGHHLESLPQTSYPL